MSLRGTRTQFATSKPGITKHILFRFLNKISLPDTLSLNNGCTFTPSPSKFPLKSYTT